MQLLRPRFAMAHRTRKSDGCWLMYSYFHNIRYLSAPDPKSRGSTKDVLVSRVINTYVGITHTSTLRNYPQNLSSLEASFRLRSTPFKSKSVIGYDRFSIHSSYSTADVSLRWRLILMVTTAYVRARYAIRISISALSVSPSPAHRLNGSILQSREPQPRTCCLARLPPRLPNWDEWAIKASKQRPEPVDFCGQLYKKRRLIRNLSRSAYANFGAYQ